MLIKGKAAVFTISINNMIIQSIFFFNIFVVILFASLRLQIKIQVYFTFEGAIKGTIMDRQSR